MESSEGQRRLILVIPCYNEAERLDLDALAACPAPGYQIHLLLVNDGSTDRTLDRLESLRDRAPDRIEILDLQPNRGKAEAVRQGILRACAQEPDYAGFWDADLATPLDEVPRFLAVLDTRPQIDMVFGARVKLLGRLIRRKVYRHYYGRILATAISILLNLGVYDTQCGAKIFRVRPGIAEIFASPFLSRWLFDVEIIARYGRILEPRGLRLAEVIYEIPLREWRDIGHSKVRPRDAILAYADLARVYLRYLAKPWEK
ncbi:MAG TPA: glycosyltransferase [Chloroflexota bacterium]|nr:glycosyltransferase [Chloroflexota bacterium]